MLSDNWLEMYLLSRIPYIPVLIVIIVGMVLALVYWRRYPLPCLLTLIATSIMLINRMLDFLIYYLLYSTNFSIWRFGTWLTIAIGVGFSMVNAAAFGLLLVAVFVGRKGAQPANKYLPVEPSRPEDRHLEEQGIKNQLEL